MPTEILPDIMEVLPLPSLPDVFIDLLTLLSQSSGKPVNMVECFIRPLYGETVNIEIIEEA